MTETWLTTRQIAARLGFDQVPNNFYHRLGNAYRLGILRRRPDPEHINRWLWALADDKAQLLPAEAVRALAAPVDPVPS